MPLYSSTFVPPAPALEVEVRNAQTGASTSVLAKIDTGADSSVIPELVVPLLGLIPFDMLVSMAFDGSAYEQTSYLVDMALAGRTFTEIEVITSPLPYLLIGRDLLNQFVTTFNGPQLTFEIH